MARLLLFLIVLLADQADAAERRSLVRVTGWSVDLYWKDPESAGKAWQRLSGYVETRDQCETLRRRTVTIIKGGTLVCRYVDELQLVPQ